MKELIIGFISIVVLSLIVSACAKPTEAQQRAHEKHGVAITEAEIKEAEKEILIEKQADVGYHRIDDYTNMYVDPETGCEYLYTNASGVTFTPRMAYNSNGVYIQRGCIIPGSNQ